MNIELEVYEAAAVMELLLREQKQYSFSHAPQRIEYVRSAITKIDNALTDDALKDKDDVVLVSQEVEA